MIKPTGTAPRILPLASGSSGNAVIVIADGIPVLVDAGLKADALDQRLREVGMAPRDLAAVLLTHRHMDHIRGAAEFAVRHRRRLVATHNTFTRLDSATNRLRFTLPNPPGHDPIPAVDGLMLRAFPVPHDAAGSIGFRIGADPMAVGFVTDLGSVTPRIEAGLRGCAAIYLEANHDLDMLLTGGDPPVRKERIAARDGHLANHDAAELLRRVAHRGLREVWLGHLSQRNNRPERALAAARGALAEVAGCRIRVAPSDPMGPLPPADPALPQRFGTPRVAR